jgi:hypothetical protein
MAAEPIPRFLETSTMAVATSEEYWRRAAVWKAVRALAWRRVGEARLGAAKVATGAFWEVKVRLVAAFSWKRAAGRATLVVWAMVAARRLVKTRVAAIVMVFGRVGGGWEREEWYREELFREEKAGKRTEEGLPGT